MYRLGIDLGGTKIEGVVLDDRHETCFRERIPTEQENGYEHILDNIARLYQKMATSIDHAKHTFGIGTPGAVSSKTGLLKNSNTVCMNQKPIIEDITKRINRPLGIQNDANCFAMAEAIDGAGAGHDLVFGIIMGTGCGGGIVYRSRVFAGQNSIAGEWGHMSIDPKGPDCYCGQKGCVETFISGGGLEKLYEQQFGKKESLKKIVQHFRNNEQPATDFMQSFFYNFGRSLSNLINCLDPDVVVLGGGLSNIDELYSKGVEQVYKMVMGGNCDTPIVKNKLGDSAGVIGAALIGR